MNIFNNITFVKNKESLLDSYHIDDDCEYVIRSSHNPINSSFDIFDENDTEEQMFQKMKDLQNLIRKTSNF